MHKFEYRTNSGHVYKRKKSRTKTGQKQVNEINKSINILNAYGEFDKFLLVAK